MKNKEFSNLKIYTNSGLAMKGLDHHGSRRTKGNAKQPVPAS